MMHWVFEPLVGGEKAIIRLFPFFGLEKSLVLKNTIFDSKILNEVIYAYDFLGSWAGLWQ